MKKITGYVLVKETSSGVPHLIVAAYDSEKPVSTVNLAPGSKSDFRMNDLGKRIGSVLTDQGGRFVLTSEDLEFQGNESRPDLLLIVLAPEDVQGIEQPFPLAPEKRVLYMSSAPLQDAGAEEAFVVRLRQEQLDAFGISTDQVIGAGVSRALRFANVVESTWSFNDSFKKRLNPRMREEQQKAEARKQKAQQQVKDLSAIPLHMREYKFLIRDRNDLKANLKQKQADAIADGLERMSELKPVLRLTLTPADLGDLGLKRDGNKITGKVTATVLAAKVRALIKGVDLVRVRATNNPDPDELERKYLSGGTNDATVGPIV